MKKYPCIPCEEDSDHSGFQKARQSGTDQSFDASIQVLEQSYFIVSISCTPKSTPM